MQRDDRHSGVLLRCRNTSIKGNKASFGQDLRSYIPEVLTGHNKSPPHTFQTWASPSSDPTSNRVLFIHDALPAQGPRSLCICLLHILNATSLRMAVDNRNQPVMWSQAHAAHLHTAFYEFCSVDYYTRDSNFVHNFIYKENIV